MISELQLRPQQWPDTLPIFQWVRNNSPSRHRAENYPITAFTDMNPSPLILKFLDTDTGIPVVVTDTTHE